MNEVFTILMDTLDEKESGDEKLESANESSAKGEKLIIRNLHYFPYIVYIFIFANDISTALRAYELAPFHTIFQLLISYLIFCGIADLCRRCNNEKLVIEAYYSHTFSNRFKFDTKNFTVDLDEKPYLSGWIKRNFFFLGSGIRPTINRVKTLFHKEII